MDVRMEVEEDVANREGPVCSEKLDPRARFQGKG